MSGKITLRPARRVDLPTMARITNAGYEQSALHKRVARFQDQHPVDYYLWRLRVIQLRFVSPELRTMLAVDSTSGQILGIASWAVEGTETALYKQWTSESSWSDWLNKKLIEVERKWASYMGDKSMDYQFLARFMAAFLGAEKAPRPACLHLHMIVVDPEAQTKGAGRMLVDWGKELSMKEGLPVFLEATLEAIGFYEKIGFARLNKDIAISPEGQETIRIPAFVWEGEGREGRWLQRDEQFSGEGTRWKWRDDVLSK